MRPMARVERFFERLVERPTARVFGTRIQVVQVLRRIEREMEGRAERSGEGRVAPDQIVVRLAPTDLDRLQPVDATAEELASGALAFARSHGFLLRERPSVALEAAAGLVRGDPQVDVRFAPPRTTGRVPDQPDGTGGPAGTRVYEVPVVHVPRAALELAEPGRAKRRVELGPGPATLGRGSDCEVALADAHASRHHARLEVRGGVLVLTDLESTNGTLVNGRRIREIVLGVGDRIDLGQTTVRVVATDAPGG
jgi:hypothetical protein